MFLTVSDRRPVNLLLATSMTGVHSLPLGVKRITSAYDEQGGHGRTAET